MQSLRLRQVSLKYKGFSGVVPLMPISMPTFGMAFGDLRRSSTSSCRVLGRPPANSAVKKDGNQDGRNITTASLANLGPVPRASDVGESLPLSISP